MIRIDTVSKQFVPGGPAALEGVSLHVGAGEVFGIIGRSGAGKSTLIRMINGLERPSAGQVSVAGEDLATLSPAGLRALRRRIGMIFQQFGLLASASVIDNVALPLRIAGIGKTERHARAAALLERVGLADHAGKYPSQLSGGQKQRVGIARAIAADTQILLCDEATSALDPETTRDILGLVAELNRELGLTVVLITHEMEVVRQVCDRVAVLHQGRVVESGAVSDIFLRPQAAETRLLLERAGALLAAEAPAFDGPVVRFTWRDTAAAGQPALTQVARETGTDLVLLAGHVGQFKDGLYGEMLLGLRGGDIEAARAALRRHGEVTP